MKIDHSTMLFPPIDGSIINGESHAPNTNVEPLDYSKPAVWFAFLREQGYVVMTDQQPPTPPSEDLLEALRAEYVESDVVEQLRAYAFQHDNVVAFMLS
jgi:hypothetical protein